MKKFFAFAVTALILSQSSAMAASVAVDNGKIVTGKTESIIPISEHLLVTPEDSTNYKRTLVAVRQITGFEASSLALAAKFWPKISIVCDGNVIDSGTGIVLKPITVLRVVAQADITNCASVSIVKPSDLESIAMGESTINWYFMGGEAPVGQ